MERFLSKLIEKLENTKAGILCAFAFFIIGILFCVFGFFKTIFIILFTAVGFFAGAFLFSDMSRFKRFLDRIIPPGRIR
ncbi:MAG: DUF2273 domain-containing protein [Clostridiales bacterium]|nr:DUF2273 domain-containing protein [Clostridiales bacterium]